MRDMTSGIEVRILPYASPDPYQEHTAPVTSDLAKQNLARYGGNVCYITPKGGDRLRVQVIIHPYARFKGQPEFNINYTIDGTILFSTFVARPPGRAADRVELVKTLDGYSSTVNGERKGYSFLFADAQMDDDPACLSRNQVKDAINKRGKIEVVLERGRSHMDKVARNSKEPSFCAAKVNKKVLHDSGKSLFTKVVPLAVRSSDVAPKSRVFKPATGPAAGQIKFTFFYTSRMYLELQRIIPIIEFTNKESEPIVIDSDSGSESEIKLERPSSPSRSRSEGVFMSLSSSDTASEHHSPSDPPDDENDPDGERSMSAFAAIRQAAEENLYDSTPPRNLRPSSAETDDFVMHGGAGSPDRSPSMPHRTPRTTSSADLHSVPPSDGYSSVVLRKRKIEEAEREERELEARLREARAKRRRLAES